MTQAKASQIMKYPSENLLGFHPDVDERFP
jgi:hypothetical protein